MKQDYLGYITDIIGKKIQILSTTNKYNLNREGVVVNETKNMLYLLMKDSNTINSIAKCEINLVKIHLTLRECIINGRSLLGRPEERFLKLK